MGDDPRIAAAPPLPYERWALRFEELVVSDLLAYPPDSGDERITATGVLEEAEDLLLCHLNGALLFEGQPDAVENPPVPAAVAEVYAEQQAATSLLARLFDALFEPEAEASVYTAVGGYDADGLPEMLAPFVVVVCGPQAYDGRRVLYEGEWLLEYLVVEGPRELRDLHARLQRAVEDYRTVRPG